MVLLASANASLIQRVVFGEVVDLAVQRLTQSRVDHPFPHIPTLFHQRVDQLQMGLRVKGGRVQFR